MNSWITNKHFNIHIHMYNNCCENMWFIFQLGLAAFDSDYPNDKAYANVTLTVIRNPNAPEFTNPSYSITVNESYPLAVSLLQVSGQDADQVHLSLSLKHTMSFYWTSRITDCVSPFSMMFSTFWNPAIL